MKIGVITASQEEYAVRLLYFLKYNSRMPDHIILLRKSLASRIIGNLNLQAIISFLQERFVKRSEGNNAQHIDHLALFLESQKINVPDISISKACRQEGVTLIRISELHSEKTLKLIRKTGTDLLLNAGGGIFRSGIIDTINIGILNAHMGYLPDFRGMNVLEWSLFYGKTIGVTMHLIDRDIDTGDILSFKEIPIEQGDTIDDLRNKSAVANLMLFDEVITGFATGNIKRERQSPELGKQYFVMHPRLKSFVEKELSGFKFAQPKNGNKDASFV